MTTTDRLTTALAGRYRLERELGQGGMATVYLAEDLRHDRKVAVKVLRPELAAVLGAERFVHEIKTTAALQHPHILPLFDSGTADSFLYYVMPYLQGETIREKLNRETQFGIDEAVKITTEVAEALDYAHQHGVIHRDIKPENILLHARRPMVMDFGIALAVSAAAGGRMTETGLSLGTPHYMSPEQATAVKDITARSDIYSLASVLYEMLAGVPPHEGGSAQQTIMRIITETPKAVSELRRSVPPNVAAALARALEKLPADRFDSAKAFAEALHNAGFVGSAHATAVPGASRSAWRGLAGWVVAGVLLVGLLWQVGRGRPSGDGAPLTFSIAANGDGVVDPVIAEDGTIYIRSGDEILVRKRDALDFMLLHREDGLRGGVTLSPDGQWIAFTAASTGGVMFLKMPAAGGPRTPVMPGTTGIGGFPVWGDDGWIYFEGQDFVGRVPENGGEIDTVLAPGHYHPLDVLPQGRGLLLRAIERNAIVALDLRTRDTLTLATDAVDEAASLQARWSTSGHVLYSGGEGALFAVPMDQGTFTTTGPPVKVVDHVVPASPFDLSRSGILVYNEGRQRVLSRMQYWWLGLDGSASRVPIEPVFQHTDADLAPDGTAIAYTRGQQVHVFDVDRGSDRSIAQGHHDPVWSPDGQSLAYRNDVRGAVMVSPATTGGEPRTLAAVPATSPAQWLEDGTVLLATFAGDVRVVDSAAGASPRDLFVAAWDEGGPVISPDRRWMAYFSDEDGLHRAYVRSWPGLGDRTMISGTDTLPNDTRRALFWSPDSRTLYYVTHDGAIVAARLGGTNQLGVAGRSRVAPPQPGRRVEALDPRRGRFLAIHPMADPTPEDGAPASNRLVVLTDFLDVLRRRLGSQ